MSHRQPQPRLPKPKTSLTTVQVSQRKNLSHNPSSPKSVGVDTDNDIFVRLRNLEEMVEKLQDTPENDLEGGCGCAGAQRGVKPQFLSLQHRHESFQNERPCQNQDAPEFPEFSEINELKAQIQDTNMVINSGCTKHMTGNLKLLCNFMEKYMGMVRFKNDQFAPILGYEDLVQGNFTIKRVYYVEGLNHNLFSDGQLCDADLEVAFRKSTCFVTDL
ncbi:hypothetical protein Tco_1093506 [Tanacetum coccineum]|uniref:Retrovirus-related Pol polyprotein from transposon TNT 1-94-like beta-barrel domain-containing protein n=1 Tax=Tanacetum coccineum TaxID=301880 RepID=A0ABQ5IF32_9ASTR